jgi:cytochrome c556
MYFVKYLIIHDGILIKQAIGAARWRPVCSMGTIPAILAPWIYRPAHVWRLTGRLQQAIHPRTEFFKMNKVLLSGLLSGLLLAPGLLLADGHDPVLKRQQLMEDTRDAVKPMGDMAKGEQAFDVAIVAQNLLVLESVAADYGNHFPPGSETGHDTEARPEIWTDRAGFDARLADFGDAVAVAIEANPQTVEELRPVLNGVFKTCKGCHEGFRVDKD